MTAAALIERADALRPNHYSPEQKLSWLCRLDAQIFAELIKPRNSDATAPAGEYSADTELLESGPYAEELYLCYLFSQIDLNNAEIQKYNQSAALLAAAWRSLADSYNRKQALKARAFRF